MKEDIQKILHYAVMAPSGDNVQPWSFTVDRNRIILRNLPDRDRSLYNYKQIGSYIAHGALIENLHVAAGVFGFAVSSLELFPDKADPELVASIAITKTPSVPKEQLLFDAIPKRSTNRKPYSNKALSSPIQEALQKSLHDYEGKLTLIEDEQLRAKAGKAFAENERVLFGNNVMHDTFFDSINWINTSGFPLASLEIPPEGMPIFKLMRSWKWTHFFHTIGLTNVIIGKNGKSYASAGAIGIVTMPSNTPTNADFVELGRVLERIWLTATTHGLSFQPLMGILFLHRYLLNNGDLLSENEKDCVERAYSSIEHISQTHGEAIGIAFRVGFADMPSFRTERDEPSITYIHD